MKLVSPSDGCAENSRWQAMQRREFLRVGGLSALGLTLPGLWAAQARAAATGERTPAKAKSCILLFLSGGPSQFETFDPKPEATSEVRCQYGIIRTSVPGLPFCEHIPHLAQMADRCTVIRSAWHRYGGHFGGHRYALTGHAAPGNTDQQARPDDKPGIVALAAKYLPHRQGTMPPTYMMPWVATDQGSGASGGMAAATLGRQYDPVRIECDPRSMERPGAVPVYQIPEFALQPGTTPQRLEGRRHLLGLIESQRQEMLSSAPREMDTLYQNAYDLLTSNRIKEGFDLDLEAGGLRDRYGRNAVGQSCLMARRLVERGARFIQINFSRVVTQRSYGWDTHDRGNESMRDHLLPKLDAGLGTLLRDLEDRGLLEETLVVAMGEFGRTPRLKRDGGRDHWPQCYSLLLAGGGVHRGLVHGRSERLGARPASEPVEAREILVTIMHLLGIPEFVTDNQGRAAPLFPGVEPIRRLYS